MKIKKCCKRFVTLLEVMIAMVLLSGLLLVIFGFFSELTKIDMYARSNKVLSFQNRYVEYRLSYLFSRIPNESDIKKDFEFFLETSLKGSDRAKGSSLVFIFDNGPRSEPTYSGYLLARLYVDSQSNQLCLVTWPLFDSAPKDEMHKEILLDHVESIKFEFFAGAGNDKNPSRPTPLSWQDTWLRDYNTVPPLVKITLTTSTPKDETKKKKYGEKEQTLTTTFVFALPVSQDSKNTILLQ